MFKKVLSSLIVLGLLVCGVWLVGAKTKTESKISANSSESGQSVSNTQKTKAIKSMKLEEKVIEEVLKMREDEYSSPIYVTWGVDESKIIFVVTPDLSTGVIVEYNIKTKKSNTLTYPYDIGMGEPPYGSSFEPDVSPDKRQIVYVFYKENDVPQVYKMDVDGKNKIRLTTDRARSPKWSPDGKKILYLSAGVFIMNIDGSEKKLIYKYKPDPEIKHGEYIYGVNWSPDGKKIVMNIKSRGNICIIDADGKNLVQITMEGNVDMKYVPTWSPNGKKIAYTIYGDEKCPNYIMIINADGSNPTKLLLPNSLIGACPVWSKDGKRLLIIGKKDITPEEGKMYRESAGIYILKLPESIL